MVSKKIFKVLVILFLIAVYFNVGYWSGRNFENAQIKCLQDEELGCFEKFQLGGYKMIIPYSSIEDAKKDLPNARIVSCAFWPIGLIASLGNWIIYGIVQAIVAVFHAVIWFVVTVLWQGIVVFLWKFFFCGGFFKLLGITTYHWILTGINLIAGALLIRWGWWLKKRGKVKGASGGMNSAMVSTITCGLFGIITLAFGVVPAWLIFYSIWCMFLLHSIILNILKF